MSTFFYNKLGGITIWQGKEPNRYRTKEEKLKSIKDVFNGESSVQVAKKYELSGRMLRNLIIKYNKYGASSLENKKKLRNPLCKYAKRKNVTRSSSLRFVLSKTYEKKKKRNTEKERP